MIAERRSDSVPPAQAQGLRRLAWPLSLLAITVGVSSPGLVSGPSIDAAVFTEVSTQLRNGAVLYRDVWDHKPPLIYVIDAVVQAGLPMLSAWVASWFVSVVALVVTGFIAERLAQLAGDSSSARATGLLAVVLSGAFPLALGGGLTETVATPIAGLGILMLFEARGRVWPDVLAGLLLGCAALTSLQLLPALVGAAVVVWAGRRQLAALLQRTTFLGLGVAVTLLVATGWLWLAGALGSAYDVLVVYSAAYTALSRSHLASSVIAVGLTLLVLPALLVPMVLAGPHALMDRMRRVPVARACAAWAASGLLLVAVQGRVETHYAIPLILPLAVLAGPSLTTLGRRRGVLAPTQGWRRIAVVAAIVFSLVTVAAGTVIGLRRNFLVGLNPDSEQSVAAWLDARTPDTGRIFVWGNEPSLYLYARRAPASKYLYAFPLTTPGYSSASQVSALVAELAANPPIAIVDASSTARLPPLLLPHPVDVRDGRSADVIGGLRQFVAQDYRLAAVVAEWPIYVHK